MKASLTVAADEAPKSVSPAEAPIVPLEQLEKQAIEAAVERYNGNLSQVAASLGITRQSLYRRMEKFGIKI